MFLVFWRHTIDFKICDLQIFYLNISDLQFSPQNLWPLNFWPNIFTKYLWPMFVFNQEYWFRNYIKDTATSHYFFDVSKILTVPKSKGGRPPPSPPPWVRACSALTNYWPSSDLPLTHHWPPPLTPTTNAPTIDPIRAYLSRGAAFPIPLCVARTRVPHAGGGRDPF